MYFLIEYYNFVWQRLSSASARLLTMILRKKSKHVNMFSRAWNLSPIKLIWSHEKLALKFIFFNDLGMKIIGKTYVSHIWRTGFMGQRASTVIQVFALIAIISHATDASLISSKHRVAEAPLGMKPEHSLKSKHWALRGVIQAPSPKKQILVSILDPQFFPLNKHCVRVS